MLALAVDLWKNTQWDDALIGSAAVATALAVIWRQVIRPVVKGVTRGAEAWEWIEKQLQTNGGESLRDKVDQHTDDVAAMRAQLDHIALILTDLPILTGRIAGLEAELAALKGTT